MIEFLAIMSGAGIVSLSVGLWFAFDAIERVLRSSMDAHSHLEQRIIRLEREKDLAK